MSRLVHQGRRGVDGAMVKLQTWLLPMGRVTDEQAINDFIAELNGQRPAAEASSRKRSHDAAAEEMAAAGIH